MKKIQSHFLPAVVVGLATIVTSGMACADTVYVTNNGDNSVEEIAADGSLSAFIPSSSGDLFGPTGLAFDSAGDLFVANNANPTTGFIAEFTSTGTFIQNYATNLYAPRGVAFDSAGNLFVTNQSIGTISEIASGGGPAVTVVTGLTAPNGLTFDSTGNLYVANGGGNNTISKVTFSSVGVVGTVSTFINSGLDNPNGLAFSGGDLIEVDTDSGSILKFDLSGSPVSPVPFISDPANPQAVAVNSTGDYFVVEQLTNSVGKYDSAGNLEATYNTPGAFSYPCYITTLAVPEPSTYAYLAAGLALLFFVSRRKTARL